MKIYSTSDAPQGGETWMRLRAGRPTASELNELLDSKLEMRSGETPKTYLARKLAEYWTGYPMASFTAGVMEQGELLEDEAIPWYEVTHDVDVKRVGFITTDDGLFGCSPDGLLDGCGMEIKCPQPPTHIKWLLSGGVPVQHLLQCEGGMYATGYERWVFVSYCRGFPPLVREVIRQQESMEAIDSAVRTFHSQLAAGYEKLVEANGGPPKREVQPASEPADEYVFA